MDGTRRINVVLGDNQHLVGELFFEATGGRQHSVFRYHEQWLENPLSFALTPSMPLRTGGTPFAGDGAASLPDPVADTAPDNWGRSIIQAYLGRGATELEILLSVADETRSGALRYVDEQGKIQSTDTPSVPRLPTLVDLRRLNQRFERGEGNLTQIARELRGTGDSLGGARPKSAIYDGDLLAIAKYTSERDTLPVEQMEVATLNLAHACGLRASKARVELLDSPYPVAIIQRFDRTAEGRIHFVSGRSFLNLRGSNAPVYYTDVAEVMRGNCGNGEQTLTEIRELYRRVIFMILVSNTDDHMKNHGFLYAGNDRWVLSPAFDINPQPYRQAQLKTGISELSGSEPSIKALVEAAPLFEIDETDAARMVCDMAAIIEKNWKRFAEEAGLSQEAINQYDLAFNHREMTIASAMG